jgi:hypothetical protein
VDPGALIPSHNGAINLVVSKLKQIVLYKSPLVSSRLGGQRALNALTSPIGVNLFPLTATVTVQERAARNLVVRRSTHQMDPRYLDPASQRLFIHAQRAVLKPLLKPPFPQVRLLVLALACRFQHKQIFVSSHTIQAMVIHLRLLLETFRYHV